MGDFETFTFSILIAVLTATIIYIVAFFIKDYLETRKLKKIALEKLFLEVENNNRFMTRFPNGYNNWINWNTHVPLVDSPYGLIKISDSMFQAYGGI